MIISRPTAADIVGKTAPISVPVALQDPPVAHEETTSTPDNLPKRRV